MSQFDGAPGQDSFLDIVANLVGILIILVVVVGAQAATVWSDRAPTEEQNADKEKLVKEIDARSNESRSVHAENVELNEKIRYQNRLNQQLSSHRHRLLVELESESKRLDEEEERLDSEKSKRIKLLTQVDSIQNQIKQVRYEFSAVENLSVPKVTTIDHYPTPIAKTVFADEVHFQIKNNRIAYVPMDELINAMKAEWKLKASKLSQSGDTSETVGPIQDFRLRYFLNRKRPQSASTPHTGISFQGFVMQPTRANLGESIDNALQETSELSVRLNKMNPSKTTVSFWIYPDSYNQLFKLRTKLREKGFQTACWPLEDGQPISGGPRGFRTSTN